MRLLLFRSTTLLSHSSRLSSSAVSAPLPPLAGLALPKDLAGQCEWLLATANATTMVANYDAVIDLARQDARAWLAANGWL